MFKKILTASLTILACSSIGFAEDLSSTNKIELRRPIRLRNYSGEQRRAATFAYYRNGSELSGNPEPENNFCSISVWNLDRNLEFALRTKDLAMCATSADAAVLCGAKQHVFLLCKDENGRATLNVDFIRKMLGRSVKIDGFSYTAPPLRIQEIKYREASPGEFINNGI